jgi:hypothetical protein
MPLLRVAITHPVRADAPQSITAVLDSATQLITVVIVLVSASTMHRG